ncbi:MAG: helix-turn-helix domain-containing protein [Planctomycetes bacterium]|nr:helix-turn-helix domain-containing protein [Planctomycetota bacterium]
MFSEEACYRALCARDRRFDGMFFVGVVTTGVYCRPVCPARTPRRDRCRYFSAAAAAERDGFRPCLRCRPELAPGRAPMDSRHQRAAELAARIDAGALDHPGGLERLAVELRISSRQLRRIVTAELGVSPVALAQTRRLLLAKQLLTDTQLPIIEVAHASGFSSVRRFNELFRLHYRLTPGRLRKQTGRPADSGVLRLTLAYRPPLAWEELLRFLAARAIYGVESVEGDLYARTVAMGENCGWIKVARPGKNVCSLSVELSASLSPVLPAVLARIRGLFDLDARPDAVAEHLMSDPFLCPAVRRTHGLRVPGAFDPFELAWRAVLGQQVSVRAATALAGRVAETFGEPATTPFPALNRYSPDRHCLAAVEPAALARLGIVRARARAIVALARAAVATNVLEGAGGDPEQRIERLKAIPGIGPWTAGYIAMRVLRWPDAWPEGDGALRKALATTSDRALRQAAERWRPWRAYAVMYLWQSLTSKENKNHELHIASLPNRAQPRRRVVARRAARGHRRNLL